MVQIEAFEPTSLPQIQAMANSHLSQVVPGWALPADYIAERLKRNPDQFILDPWVVERNTIVAEQAGKVHAVAHLLRYGDREDVSQDYRNVGEIDWFLFWPKKQDSAAALLNAAKEQMRKWQTRTCYAPFSLPVPVVHGVPDAWPHIKSSIVEAGFYTSMDRTEAVYSGGLPATEARVKPPVPGVYFEQHTDASETQFAAKFDQEPIGVFVTVADLSKSGKLPALSGWGELADIQVSEKWRDRGIGSWPKGQVVRWLRSTGCKQVVLNVSSDDEAKGAGRFYRRFGWDIKARLEIGWRLDAI